MALILSVDTSTSVCSVALHNQGELLASQENHGEKSHSSHLVPMIKSLLEQLGVEVPELSAIAVAKGPGSYTGLRIGVSTAKGLCYSHNIKLISINTLLCMASDASNYVGADVLLCPMLDARRMEVYSLLTDADLNEVEPTKAVVLDEGSFDKWLDDHKVCFFGNGCEKAIPLFERNPNARFLRNIYPNAKHIGKLAQQRFKENRFEDVAYFEPYYLKDFVAAKPARDLLGIRK